MQRVAMAPANALVVPPSNIEWERARPVEQEKWCAQVDSLGKADSHRPDQHAVCPLVSTYHH